MKTAIVTGAGGFIGSHLVLRLKREGYWVEGVDIKHPEFAPTTADQFFIRDLRDPVATDDVFHPVDEVYTLAAQMGGAEYVFTGTNDAEIVNDSALINLNVAAACRRWDVGRVFFSSSACIYPDFVQHNTDNCALWEDMAWPARPDSAYGLEKLFSEELYKAYAKNHQMQIRIARLHAIYGPLGTWRGGREKAPAAICRKVAETPNGGTIDIIGDGNQTRSFLYVDECIEGIRRLMNSGFAGPVNLGSAEMVSINQLAEIVCDIAGKQLNFNHIPGPEGVRGRTSDNALIQEKLGWAPSASLREGLVKTYSWVKQQVEGCASTAA
jgi:nucleoside-diphosphate-sugar epimerase